jgi:hypothetical protein
VSAQRYRHHTGHRRGSHRTRPTGRNRRRSMSASSRSTPVVAATPEVEEELGGLARVEAEGVLVGEDAQLQATGAIVWASLTASGARGS